MTDIKLTERSAGGWDIVCSYSVPALNGSLWETWVSGQKENNRQIVIDNEYLGSRHSFKVNFGSPELSFDNADGPLKAVLVMPLAGSYSTCSTRAADRLEGSDEGPHEDYNIAAGRYFLRVKVPLRWINGQVLSSCDDDRVGSSRCLA